MTTATYLIIAGITLGVVCGALALWGRGRYRDLSSVFLVVGILVLAIGVTVQQIYQYRQQGVLASQSIPAAQPDSLTASGGSMPPAARPVPILPPLGMRGPSGAAAPSPYAGGMR